MQRQQERARPNRPKPRRTVGELLTAWLVLLWGLGLGGFYLPFALMRFNKEHFLISDVLFLLQAALCIVSGLCAFLRLRLLAKYGLIVAALCFLGLAVVTVWSTKGVSDVEELLWIVAFVILATLLFFLGRWLGQQGESEGQ